jgi:hypothetical protein
MPVLAYVLTLVMENDGSAAGDDDRIDRSAE